MEIEFAPVVKRDGINWITVTAFAVFHLGAVAALFFFSWPAFFAAVFLYWASLSLGIGMGYHRLLTHRSYQVPKWLEYSLAVCGTLALEGGPIFWVATHRVHHQFSDKQGDPHTPRDGKWWSHIIWMMVGDVTHCDSVACARYAPSMNGPCCSGSSGWLNVRTNCVQFEIITGLLTGPYGARPTNAAVDVPTPSIGLDLSLIHI